LKQVKRNRRDYNPNLGFIGNAQVEVANYLFSAKSLRKAYQHAKPVADRILNKEVSTHYHESKKLTKFLKNRDLTFSKKTNSGEYKTFVVPCTTTVVPLQKSLFNDVELAAQRLIISLRKVLQDIYGSESLEASAFVQSLPESVRDIFIHSIKSSASYFPQLHHKNMKDYPFLDNVGLDLVLVEDYLQKSASFPKLIAKNNSEELPGLPFRILELNAGSPSGASNNMNMIEGIYQQNPEILDSLGKVMPNDHFKILGETYKSLGEAWTGITDGVQILLPPGGQNGASPEIHQLAAYSGLIYADPDQLYQDAKGYIRLRTVSTNNPIVTAIYSRVNTDSALFDPKAGIFLRDPDSGESIYLRDWLKLDKNGEAEIVKDANGNPVPLRSAYAIPGALNAILNRKLYMGGLNRIMDNKIILATLTHYAPKYFASAIEAAGLDVNGAKILPPQTLPPTRKSAEIIAQNPDEWVVKAPDLAGGQGVYILKTLPAHMKKEVLAMIMKNPEDYAYQQLVKIARIPVAVHRKNEGYKFANLAADIRMWVFFGAGENVLPKISHNALVRYAPQEKGKMSSIVNTSKGGGYAPFVIVDDTNDKNAVRASELAKAKMPIPHKTALPVFVAAQMVQISRMLKEAMTILNKPEASTFELHGIAIGLKMQLKEVLSFLHPRVIENIYKMIDVLESKLDKNGIASYFRIVKANQINLVQQMKKVEADMPADFRDTIDNIRGLSIKVVNTHYTEDMRALDLVLVNELKQIVKESKIADKKVKKDLQAIIKTVNETVTLELPLVIISTTTKKHIIELLENFCEGSRARLLASEHTAEFAELFTLNPTINELKFDTLYLSEKDQDKEISNATQFEMRTNTLIADSDIVPANLQNARKDWMAIEQNARLLKKADKEAYLAEKRKDHFAKYPELNEYQALVNKTNANKHDIIKLLDVVPYAKFNLLKFANAQGLTLEEVFANKLENNKVSILTTEELKELKLCSRDHAGECFAKKKKSHGLYSESDIYVWLRAELDAFTMAYTIGHELVHYQQIKNSMDAEKRALKDGGLSAAKFLNYYGNFLGGNRRSVDLLDVNMQSERKPLYGYADRVITDYSTPIITDLRSALNRSDASWERQLNKYGSLFGYMMPNAAGTRVKALQEVIPALENAKNILFAQELGLEVKIDAVESALPIANKVQVETFKSLILTSAMTPSVNWEALRIIANHQYHGVSFCRADREEENLTLIPIVTTVAVGSSYNQTQQQQQQ
jgi:uncharacterized circularly permuted ATP-grasp superfamily protein